MLGVVFRLFLALALWPLIVSSLMAGLYIWALLIQAPRIYRRYGGYITAELARWFGLIAGLSFMGVVIGTILVVQAPFSDFPTSFDIKPIAWAGLLLSAWSVFGFVLATELTSARARKPPPDVPLDDILQSAWS